MSSCSSFDPRSRESSGARVWKPTSENAAKPQKFAARPHPYVNVQDQAPVRSNQEITNIMDNDDRSSPTSIVIPPPSINNGPKPTNDRLQNQIVQDLVMNTPAYIPPTPKWCQDYGRAGMCKTAALPCASTGHAHFPSPTRSYYDKRPELTSIPFETPPLSVFSNTATPDHQFLTNDESMTTLDHNGLSGSNTPVSPILPPDSFRDEINRGNQNDLISSSNVLKYQGVGFSDSHMRREPDDDLLPPPPPQKKRRVLRVTQTQSQVWSEAEDAGSDWSQEGSWSEEETTEAAPPPFGIGTRKHKSASTATTTIAASSSSFSSIFHQTRVTTMTPRSQEISQILDDLYTMMD